VSAPAPGDLRRVLDEARSFGFLGPEDPQRHIDHAAVFAGAAEDLFGPGGPAAFLDLGSGAGVPGLVLALRWRGTHATLLDANRRRCDFARGAAQRLALADRVTVRCERAEVAGRDPGLRGSVAMVVARAFGPPAVTAELAAPFLEDGGVLLVSEPPQGDRGRWDPAGLALLGLGPAASERFSGYGIVVMRKVGPTPERFPRRTGVPMKRPLW
jgi:16S rRNA (guanine527-N7)-methyltransferase